MSYRDEEKLGKYRLIIEQGTLVQEITFDPDAATPGWTALDQFDLSAGEVIVTLTPAELPCILVADAIRWMP